MQRKKHVSSPRCTLAPNQLMRLCSRRRIALMRFQRCSNQGVWVSRHEGKRTAKLSVNFSMAVLTALNPEALGRKLDVQLHGDACLVRRCRRDRVRTNFCERPPFLKCRSLDPYHTFWRFSTPKISMAHKTHTLATRSDTATPFWVILKRQFFLKQDCV